MFNKRDTSQADTTSHSGKQVQTAATHKNTPPAATGGKAGQSSTAAIIGPTISVDGIIKGEEDLVVEGRIKGTVELRSNTLTIGAQGTLSAQVYAHTILVDGTVNGDLYASERISIHASARIDGNILAPRISLEDGARFRGSIDMDPESEAFRNAFQSESPKPASSSGDSKTAQGHGGKVSGKHDGEPRSAASDAGKTPANDKRNKTGTTAP